MAQLPAELPDPQSSPPVPSGGPLANPRGPQPEDAGAESPRPGREGSRRPGRRPTAEDAGEEAPAAENNAAPGADAAGLFRAFRRRWLLGLTLGILCAGAAGAAAWFFFPPGKYVVHTLFRVKAKQTPIVFPVTEAAQDPFAGDRKTQLVLLKSQVVLQTALRNKAGQVGLVKQQADPVEWLGQQLIADYRLGPELLRLSMSGDNPDELKVIVSAVADAYLKEIVDKEKTLRVNLQGRLAAIHAGYKTKLHELRTQVQNLSKLLLARNANHAAIQQQMALEQLAMSKRELTKLLQEGRRLDAELKSGSVEAPGRFEAEFLEDRLQRAIASDPRMQQLAKEAADQEKVIEEIKATGKTDAIIERVSREPREKLEAVNKKIEARRKELRKTLPKQLRGEMERFTREKQAGLKAQKEFLQNLKKEVQEDIARLTDEAGKINTQSFDLEELNEEIAQTEGFMKRVWAEKEALEVERDAPSRVSVVEDSVVTNPNNQKKKTLAAGGAAVAAFVLVVFGISWKEFRSRRIGSVDEVTEHLGMQVVGTVPNLPSRAQRRMAEDRPNRDPYWENLLTESVDSARTFLLHTARKDSLRVLMVTSAMGGEGKTSLTTHLSASLARARRRTLLIDCDFRNPSIHRVFNMALEPGFSEVLRNEVNVADAIRATPFPGVDLITAGRCDAVVLQELAQGRCGQIFDQLKEHYDFIIVDSAPVLPVADSLLVGTEVDAVLFSVMHEVSQVPKVRTACQRLNQLGVRILGAVVSAVKGGDTYYEYRYQSRGDS
jgi:capsular exopolysaccharide synthesis family protein